MNSQFVQIALPIVITLIVAVFAQIFTANKRIEDVRDVLRAEMRAETAALRGDLSSLRGDMNALHSEIAKNQSELLAKLADMENRLDRRIEKLETARWKP